jgi:hypothetical protein
MLSRPIRFASRACLLAGAALCALTAAAAAKDLPATPEGARTLSAFFSAYAGAAPAGAPPAFVVTPEGSDYLVSLDLAALAAPFKAMAVAYDPATFKFKLVEQDDGAWRLESAGIPPITAHTPHGSSTTAVTGYKGEFVIDPATAWFRTASGGADKVAVHARADAGVDETIDAGALQFSGTGSAAADGAASSVFRESAADINLSLNAQPKPDKPGDDPKTINFSAHADKATLDASLAGLKSHAALALWAFLAAHPTRPDLATNEATLKGLIAAAAAGALKLNETTGAQKIVVQTPHGPITIDSAKFGAAADAGKPGAFEEHIAFDGLALPPGLIPPLYRDLTPTSAALSFKASGFDVAAATAEAIADMHLAGDGPPLSPADRAKVWKTLLGPGTVTVDIAPSHILAPRVDVSIEGKIRYTNGRPAGALTVHMRNFENTVGALKALGPETERKLVTVLGLAKGLAKTDGDGVLTWVAELEPDGMMKVNGLPLGKAPL